MFEYSGVDTKCPYIHQLYRLNWYQYIYYSDAMHRLGIPVLKWNNTLLLFEAVCYKKHS